MLYRGQGNNDSWPNVPLIDGELTKGLARLGYKGKRTRGNGVFTSTDIDQAKDYAAGDDRLFEAKPLPGAILTFVQGSKDLVLEFESWLRKRNYDDRGSRSLRAFLADVQGDIGTVETYLRFNRQGRNVAALVDEFLSGKRIIECVVTEDMHLSDVLNGHDGEVCVTGPIELEPARILSLNM